MKISFITLGNFDVSVWWRGRRVEVRRFPKSIWNLWGLRKGAMTRRVPTYKRVLCLFRYARRTFSERSRPLNTAACHTATAWGDLTVAQCAPYGSFIRQAALVGRGAVRRAHPRRDA